VKTSAPQALRVPTVVETVAVAGRAFRLTRPHSAEELIDEAEYARDERLPYWAELWPSARVLAGALGEEPLAGRRVVELGCGLGLPSLVAAAMGARALATDWYPEALAFVVRNARAASLQVERMLVDWQHPPDALLERGPFDLVVAADVLYEARNADALLALLPALAGKAGRILIADPRRPDARLLIEPLTAAGWAHRREERPVAGRIDESGPVVHLHHLNPPAPGARSAR
jgi:predicted nicotinamide N-methyase